MSTQKHMPWYGDAPTERFEIRVPKGFKRSIIKKLFFENRKGRVRPGMNDFVIKLVSETLALDAEEVEAYFNAHFKPPGK